MSTKSGFTLAEVLITLAIIGVVAALTIPSLVSLYQKKEMEVAGKRAFSLLSQSVQRAKMDNGNTMINIAGTDIDNQAFVTALVAYFNLAYKQQQDPWNGMKAYAVPPCYHTDPTNCTGTGSMTGCTGCEDGYSLQADPGPGGPFGCKICAVGSSPSAASLFNPDNRIKSYTGGDVTLSMSAGVRSIDGSIWAGGDYNPECNTTNYEDNGKETTCGNIAVDINGDKRPNQIAKDIFFFQVTRESVTPYGGDSSGINGSNCLSQDSSGVFCSMASMNGENIETAL